MSQREGAWAPQDGGHPFDQVGADHVDLPDSVVVYDRISTTGDRLSGEWIESDVAISRGDCR